uniref:Ni/Fe hydrogenase subunit alpha n=1 Tax=candidate division WOR-3 bacterium TaxID=2052148 RepID=A0A7C4YEQ3_UNCW3
MPKEFKIDPVTRLEGHAKIEIFLDDKGDVDDAYFQVVELRGFEEFCKGRSVEEMPQIVTRLCGVCPWAHHIASAKATDGVFGVEVPPAGKKLRMLGYYAHYLESHLEHIYALGPAPDFIVGPDADPLKRNVFGVIEKVGLDIGKKVIQNRAYAVRIEDITGGKSTHPVYAIPGGVSHPLKEEERKEIEKMGESLVDFCEFTLDVVDKFILQNKKYLDIIMSKDIYYHETNYIGLVDKNNKVNFYEGEFRVVNPMGKEIVRFKPEDYLEHIGEHVEPWSYLKFPYLKDKGWKGFVDGEDSGVMRAAPLGRLNASDGFTTPKAQAAYEKFFDFFKTKPVHHTLTFHWARAIEALHAAEIVLQLSRDPEIMDRHVRNIPVPENYKGEGIGGVEAPRGSLIHHYKTDKNGLITELNLIVATAFNYAAMNMSVKKAAKALIKNGKADQGILNMVEMAFRNYDPCFSCATHSLPGTMPIVINIYDKDGNLKDVIKR